MNSYIIVGSKNARDLYINSFLKEKQIASYNIIRITEKVLIAHTRELKKRLSISSGGVMRLIILPQDITLDAQNALLKTIEELDENTSLIIESESRDSLLPTIISRCTIVMLSSTESKVVYNSDNLEVLMREENQVLRIGLVMKYIDSLGTITEDHIKQIIVEFQKLLINNPSKDSLKILKSLTMLYSLCQNNNVNKRMMLESVFLNPKLTP